MDSLTHIVLGAAIGDTLLGKKIGRKAAWMGALAKTFPDFDLFFSGLNDPRKYILYHRSYTHSFFIELITAFPLAWLSFMLFRKKTSYKDWLIVWLFCMWGHSLVDIFTNYGTRIFLPFSKQLVSLNNISIADIFLTLPILMMVIVGLLFANQSKARRNWMISSLVYACVYFSWTFYNKSVIDRTFHHNLSAQGIHSSHYMSNPSILNNFLWYAVVKTDSQIWMGEYSILQTKKDIHWLSYPIHAKQLTQHPSVDAQMLQWFSQGFYFTEQHQDTLCVYMPKFGRGDLSASKARETFFMYYTLYYAHGRWQFGMKQPGSGEIDFREALTQLTHAIGYGITITH